MNPLRRGTFFSIEPLFFRLYPYFYPLAACYTPVYTTRHMDIFNHVFDP